MAELRNSYFALRHGRSVANDRGIIVSDASNGVDGYGLSDGGRQAALDAWADDSHRSTMVPETTVVYTSDFLRARETADLFCEKFRLSAPIVEVRLRERNFGTFELTSTDNYPQVWAQDAESPIHTEFGVESVASVQARLLTLVSDLETRHARRSVILCAHGDTLQILQATLAGLPAHHHRRLPPLCNAELRPLPTTHATGVVQ